LLWERPALRLLPAFLVAAVALASSAAAAERIVFIRHGEKPAQGLGQLDCRGLNRALALPRFFARAFGRPDAIFAPNPSVAKTDAGASYDYVRPLATIEPTAIALGLPVNVGIGFDDVEGLRKALEAPALAQALVFVAWEHKLIDVVARKLVAAHGGDAAVVPDWRGEDFDGVYVVTLEAGAPAKFERMTQGLNGQPETCPR
jgi:broad specificity phosphatase PhoE